MKLQSDIEPTQQKFELDILRKQTMLFKGMPVEEVYDLQNVLRFVKFQK